MRCRMQRRPSTVVRRVRPARRQPRPPATKPNQKNLGKKSLAPMSNSVKSSNTLSRRTVLRGLGAAVSLPFLESLAPKAFAALASPATPAPVKPVRMAVLYMPNGINVGAWTPRGAGECFELSPTLSPLAPLKNGLLVFSELWNASAIGGDGHYVKTGGFLTGTTITK